MKRFFAGCFIFLLSCLPAHAQVLQDSIADSLSKKNVSINIYKPLLDSNVLLNSTGKPLSLPVSAAKQPGYLFFYFITALLLFLGIIKTFYSRYFNTLFRVFFNTSLRQNQLTDQLEQATVPSFIFNVFFVVSGGLYVYLLLGYFAPGARDRFSFLEWCIPAVAGCYLVKYMSLRLAGWLTSYRSEAGSYIFIIFLLNKVIGILLLPFIVIMLFSSARLVSYAVFVSIIMLSLIMLMRFFRSWSLLQSRLKVTKFHFFLYILSLEILPIALIYKGVLLFLGKSS